MIRKFFYRFFHTTAWKYALAGAAVGIIIFCMAFNVRSIVPTNTIWVYHATSTDLPFHQVGFDFYRNSAWQFPIQRTLRDRVAEAECQDHCSSPRIDKYHGGVAHSRAWHHSSGLAAEHIPPPQSVASQYL